MKMDLCAKYGGLRLNIFRFFNVIFVIYSFSIAILEFNDPDWWVWVLNYFIAVAICIIVFFNKLWWYIPFSYFWALMGGVWCHITKIVVLETPCLEQSYEGVGICEDLQELLGLLIIMFWMIFVTLISFRYGTLKWSDNINEWIDRRSHPLIIQS